LDEGAADSEYSIEKGEYMTPEFHVPDAHKNGSMRTSTSTTESTDPHMMCK
jgi:hypothetical protein